MRRRPCETLTAMTDTPDPRPDAPEDADRPEALAWMREAARVRSLS